MHKFHWTNLDTTTVPTPTRTVDVSTIRMEITSVESGVTVRYSTAIVPSDVTLGHGRIPLAVIRAGMHTAAEAQQVHDTTVAAITAHGESAIRDQLTAVSA